MLNKGLRDEESIRIDTVLKTLRSLVFVPLFLLEEEKINIENQLKILGLNIQTLDDFSESELIVHLVKCHLDWNNLEQFADFLIQMSKDSKASFKDFPEKGIFIYNYIQQESKIFSFGIITKIAAVKSELT